MSNQLSMQLLAEMFNQESADPFLLLVTITHPSFDTIRLVHNTEDITSRGETYQWFPMSIILPTDDGETERQASIEFDNVSLELIEEIRTVTTPMDIKLELVLASNPDFVQISYEDLKLRDITYDAQRIKARLYMDSFLNIQMTSERYTPSVYPGLF